MKAFKKFAPVIAAVLGVVAIVMLFLPAVTFKAAIGDETISYKGWETIFGLSETNKTILMLYFHGAPLFVKRLPPNC